MERRTIQRVLVACRGEPGAAVGRRLEAAGVEAVAVYADVDAEDAWLDEVSYAARIATMQGEDPYADGLRIVSAALDAGTDAVHPGPGALALDGEVARMVANVGLAWVGAPPGLLDVCASRPEVRRIAREAGFPVVPGSPVLSGVDDAAAWVARLGMPIRVAAARRGGRAEICERREDVDAAVASVASADFVVERAVRPARHLVVAVVGDGSGSAMHLGIHERSLSLEGHVRMRECPPPGLSLGDLERMAEAAVRFAQGMRLSGVGAVELLVGPDGRWWLHDFVPSLFAGYALHDLVYGVDLVAAQVQLAAGETLGWDPAEVHAGRCAVELVLRATGAGEIEEFAFPEAVEVSTTRAAGSRVDPAHDPLLALVRVVGSLRQPLLVRARAALESVRIEGVPHDIPALVALLADSRVWEGHPDTSVLASVVGEP
jgi:acetyl/propionyl-CoA carboxylase alpha subunit